MPSAGTIRAMNPQNLQLAVVRAPAPKAPKKKGPAGRGQSMTVAANSRKNAGRVDAPAREWLRLLNDPCYARLAHPVYPGADGGLLSRFESEFTFAAGATDTAGILGWIPGAIPKSLFVKAGVDDTAALALGIYAAGVPGLSFLTSVASAARCVSACIQVSWPGSELNRQGFVTLGQATGAIITENATGYGGATTTVAALRPMCNLRTRVPETMAEVKWRPALGDAQWTDPSLTTSTGQLNERGALLVTAGNLPKETGIRVRLICTYEWIPKSAQGLTSSFDNRARSVSSLDDVINALDAQGPHWAYQIGRATSVLGAMTGAYMASKRQMLRY